MTQVGNPCLDLEEAQQNFRAALETLQQALISHNIPLDSELVGRLEHELYDIAENGDFLPGNRLRLGDVVDEPTASKREAMHFGYLLHVGLPGGLVKHNIRPAADAAFDLFIATQQTRIAQGNWAATVSNQVNGKNSGNLSRQ